MNTFNRKDERRNNTVIPVIISCLICLIIYNAGWLTTTENRLHDSEAHLTRKIYDSDIIIVEIDHASLKELSGWPWPRRYYAKVISRLQQEQAKTIFLDIDFSATSNPDDDAILASALKNAGRETVLMPAFKQYSTSGSNKYLALIQPNKIIRDYVTAVSVNLKPDPDGLVRQINLHSEFAGKSLPTAAIIFNDYPAHLDEKLKLNLRIMPDSFERISFHDIYNNTFNKSLIKNKHIIIGATALELSDQIALPVYQSLAGPILQALAYQSLVNGKLYTLDRATTSIILILACLPLWLLFSSRGWRQGLLQLAIVNIAILILSLFLHANNALLLNAIPLLLLATLSYTFTQLAKLDKQLHKILRQRIALHKNETMIAHVIKNTSEGLIILNNNLLVTKANTAAKKIFENIDELINVPAKTLFPDLNNNEIVDFDNNRFETTLPYKENKSIHLEISSNRLNIDNERIYTLFIHDISQRRERQDLLLHKATHDSLTNLHNRSFLLNNIDNAIQTHNENKQSFTLIMIDLNNFKEVNDTLSHTTGDQILIKLGERLKTLGNENTCIARLGGDEFSILTRNIFSHKELDAYIKNIQELISKPIELSDISLTIDAAIGIAFIPDHATTTDDILIAADVAMYKSKSSKKAYSIYDPKYNYHAKRNLAISNDLKQALKNNQFQLHYQPQVDLKNNAVVSLEALIRWQHPNLGLITPDEFIPILENSSLIKPVTMYTIETAIIKQKELQKSGLNISIAINISAKLLGDNNLASDIIALLSLHDASAKNFKLEITESTAMENHEHTLDILNNLINNNLKLSIDDFGTSYASFSYLKKLPAKELKIEKFFIANICNDHSNQIITSSIISLAHSLNMQVVAEGVEDKDTYQYLIEQGCNTAQGYWISKPLAADRVASWISNWNKKNRLPDLRSSTN